MENRDGPFSGAHQAVGVGPVLCPLTGMGTKRTWTVLPKLGFTLMRIQS